MTTTRRLIAIALITLAGAACSPLPANPFEPATDALEPRVAACVTDPTTGWVRCMDQYGNRIEETSPLWDCNAHGNGLCSKDDQTPFQP